jgi:hypothetical protein
MTSQLLWKQKFRLINIQISTEFLKKKLLFQQNLILKMSLDRKKSDCHPEECLLKKRRSLKNENSLRNEDMMSHESVNFLRVELENESKRRFEYPLEK